MHDDATPDNAWQQPEDSLVAHLKNRIQLGQELDELVEQAQRDKSALEDLLDTVLPVLANGLGAHYIGLKTRDETLDERLFEWGQRQDQEHSIDADIEIAGDSIGRCHVAFAEKLDETLEERRQELLNTGLEVLDNYLKTIQTAREKHFLMRQLHRDLMHPLTDEGIKNAVKTLSKAVNYDLLVVIYHQSNAYEQTVRYLVFKGTRLAFDSAVQSDAELDQFVKHKPSSVAGSTMLLGKVQERLMGLKAGDLKDESQTSAFLQALGYDSYMEVLLRSGLRDPTVLGKIVVSGSQSLSTYERDLVSIFADALQKRVIDFDKESRQLAQIFNVPTVMRLLREENYRAKHLEPKRQEAAILFTDISGFTRISEQVLGEPSKVGEFIQAWSLDVTRILWQYNGACDKYVGDCLIGLFGPPFFDEDAAHICQQAIDCAIEIARFTREFSKTPAWRKICDHDIEMGVATGLNFCPVAIGDFGPCGFTAFAPGVNNTARLQGVAEQHEVLVTEAMYELLKDSGRYQFSDSRAEKVKNVKEPIKFRSLLWE